MTGNAATRAKPLLPDDPHRLGAYDVIGRLGEGGMGWVYLARSGTGRLVALKIIRPVLAHDPEFRRRFRSEVERARDVPPFCTAEVLDADPEHDPPYLVVEYVDGPSLETVIAERGPLTPANLHGLAIGVATALAGIHSAGVIHRDLKPSNILLPPGSPKVIDFGIARAVQAADSPTRTQQVIGTVAYMAPERFEPGSGRTITPAADIFAWGAVVAYAGTGRTPFGGELPHVVAARILTQEPDVEGLNGRLRDLVQQALAKHPDDRPTARELLDRLLGAGTSPAGSLAAALERQPALREAVEEVRAATDQHSVRELTAAVPPVPLPPPASGATTRLSPHVAASAAPPAFRPGAAVPSAPATAPTATPTTAAPPASPGGSGGSGGSGRSGGSGGRLLPTLFAVTTAVALVALLLLAGIVTKVIPFDRASTFGGGPSTGPTIGPSGIAQTSAGTPTPSPTGVTPSAGTVVIDDPLTAEGDWVARQDDVHGATCGFDGGLVITKKLPGPYRCPGERRPLRDFTLTVTAKLHTPGSCAGIWFRFDRVGPASSDEAGYVLRVCADDYTLLTHGVGRSGGLATVTTFPARTALGQETLVGITADGPRLTFTQDGRQVGEWRNSRFKSGRVVLGVQNVGGGRPPYRVSYRDVKVSTNP